MKPPTKCPVCGDPMLNIFPPAEDLTNSFTKYCNKRTDHNLGMAIENDEVVSLTIMVDANTQLQASWHFKCKSLNLWYLSLADKKGHSLPYFEPDLSDYRKLVNKIKTYLVFS